MSAFIVGQETIDRIITGLNRATHGTHGGFDGWPEPPDSLKVPTDEAYDEVGTALWQMNADAVDQRYNETNPIPLYHFTLAAAKRPVDQFQFLKSIRCLLYQCSEGDVPQRPLYQDLRQYSLILAMWTVERTKEYDQAVWG